MPFNIQRVPLGLPSFLRIFGGEGPRQMADQAFYTVDATPYYAASTLSATASTASTGALTNLTSTFTFGQPVRLRQIAARLTVGAAGGANVNLSVGINLPITPNISNGFGANFGAVLATEIVTFGNLIDLVVPAGTLVFARATGAPAGADHSVVASAIFDQLL